MAGRILRSLLVLLLIFGAAALGTYNSEPTVLRAPGWESPEWPLWAYLLAAVGVGIAVGGASFLADYIRLRQALRRERRRADEATARAEDAERRWAETGREGEPVRGRPGDLEEIRGALDLVEDPSTGSTAVRPGRPPGDLD